MRNNILLYNYPEQPYENCEKLLRVVLRTHTRLTDKQVSDIRFERVHRMGQAADGLTRSIVAKLSFFKDKEAILAAWKEKGHSATHKDLNKLKLTNHLPPEVLEKRAASFKVVDNMRAACSDPKDIKVKVNVDKVYVNNQLVTPRVAKPSLEEVLSVTREEKGKKTGIPCASSKHRLERGSTFVAVAHKVTCLSDVCNVYRLHCANSVFHKATHNILAYNIQGESGWLDDGEYGAGRVLTGWMDREEVKDMCFIIVRNYGGVHLGTRRFELMREVAQEAREQLLTKLR